MIYKIDGDQICCHDENFLNLQESIAGFGDTEKEAFQDYNRQMEVI